MILTCNYSGDTDSVLAVTTTRYAINKIKTAVKTPWYPWYFQGEVNKVVIIYTWLVPYLQILCSKLILSFLFQGWWSCSGIRELDICNSKRSWTFRAKLSTWSCIDHVLILHQWHTPSSSALNRGENLIIK